MFEPAYGEFRYDWGCEEFSVSPHVHADPRAGWQAAINAQLRDLEQISDYGNTAGLSFMAEDPSPAIDLLRSLVEKGVVRSMEFDKCPWSAEGAIALCSLPVAKLVVSGGTPIPAEVLPRVLAQPGIRYVDLLDARVDGDLPPGPFTESPVEVLGLPRDAFGAPGTDRILRSCRNLRRLDLQCDEHVDAPAHPIPPLLHQLRLIFTGPSPRQPVVQGENRVKDLWIESPLHWSQLPAWLSRETLAWVCRLRVTLKEYPQTVDEFTELELAMARRFPGLIERYFG